MVNIHILYMVLYIPGGTGILPPTVCFTSVWSGAKRQSNKEIKEMLVVMMLLADPMSGL